LSKAFSLTGWVGAAALTLAAATAANAQGRPATFAATRATSADLRAVDSVIDTMVRERALVVRDVQRDTLLPERVHERLDQYLRGVRVVGGDLTRQSAPDGTVSVFGTLHTDVMLDLTPRLSADEGRTAIARAAAGEATGQAAELVVLPLSDGYHLAYRGQANVNGEIFTVFVDANSGGVLQQYSEFISEVGVGTGAYGDSKKVSATAMSGTFVATDTLRPAQITTYDMKGNLARMLALYAGAATPATSDIASSANNVWTDSTVVDAQVYSGWYYDYLFKRFGRQGLNGQNLRIVLFTHPVRLADIATAASSVLGTYYVNATYCSSCGPNGQGAVQFGEGAPRNFFGGNVEIKPFSAALDVVAHELTHGVTATSARLNPFPYSEANGLNEGFSDIFGIATAFAYQAPGNAALQASYTQGRDLTVPPAAFVPTYGRVLARSISDPLPTGYPDHYSLRNIGGDPHANGVIAGHAFYLAIEGGTNRTSGRSVQGVGATNREQIEKTFFRALTMLMPSSSTFGLTRVATIQAARDLYGAGGAVERAITQAWDAVGVQERTVPAATALPNPSTSSLASASACGASPSWTLGITVSAGTSNLRITGWSSDDFNASGTLINHSVYSAASFAAQFNACGPGNTTILAQTDACASTCWLLSPGVISGSSQISFSAVDDAGRTLTFSTPRVTLR
jgi:Zn-dependent metalloprotease